MKVLGRKKESKLTFAWVRLSKEYGLTEVENVGFPSTVHLNPDSLSKEHLNFIQINFKKKKRKRIETIELLHDFLSLEDEYN